MRALLTAISAATVAVAMGLSLPLTSQASAGAFASSTNIDTGVTTTSVANPDGTRTVTTTAPGDVGPGRAAAPVAADAPEGDFASSTDTESGDTTTSVANPDGTHTVTTSSNGDNQPTGADQSSGAGESDWSDDFEEWGDDDWDNDDTASSNGDDEPRPQTGWKTTISHGPNGSRTVIWTGPNGERQEWWTAFGVAPGPYEAGGIPNPDEETWEDWTPYLHYSTTCSDDCAHTEYSDNAAALDADTARTAAGLPPQWRYWPAYHHPEMSVPFCSDDCEHSESDGNGDEDDSEDTQTGALNPSSNLADDVADAIAELEVATALAAVSTEQGFGIDIRTELDHQVVNQGVHQGGLPQGDSPIVPAPSFSITITAGPSSQ